MREKRPVEEVQPGVAEIARAVAGNVARLRELRESLQVDPREASEEMVSWRECPTLEFYVHGLLALALKDLLDASETLVRAAEATAESVREEWRKLRAAEGRRQL